MIHVSLSQFFFIGFGLLFILVITLWIYSEICKVKNPKASVVAKDRLHLCPKCHHYFLAKNDYEHVTRCPNCNEMCFLPKQKRF